MLPGEKVVRRRGNAEQGRALEALGHAVEYLVDSRMFLRTQAESDSNRDAVQMLMRLSRTVFLECPEVVPLGRKVARWVTAGVSRTGRRAA
jgi:hypothetical protein